MQSHWVDHADRFAAIMADLPAFAALYGLAPRDDEDVEEFRAHLKRYVRTFSAGHRHGAGPAAHLRRRARPRDRRRRARRVVAAPARRDHDHAARLDDAATLVFGAAPLSARGSDPLPAAVRGPDLGAGVDVRAAGRLLCGRGRRGGDGVWTSRACPTPPPRSPPSWPRSSRPRSRASRRRCRAAGCASPRARSGALPGFDLGEIDGDTAPAILGLPARRARGRAPRAARIVGRARPDRRRRARP